MNLIEKARLTKAEEDAAILRNWDTHLAKFTEANEEMGIVSCQLVASAATVKAFWAVMDWLGNYRELYEGRGVAWEQEARTMNICQTELGLMLHKAGMERPKP